MSQMTPERDPVSIKIHLDVVGGIAGDMFIAAMCDAFPSLKKTVIAGIEQITSVSGWGVTFSESKKSGIRGQKFTVFDAQIKSVNKKSNYTELCDFISCLDLSDSIKKIALKLLEIIGVAEAKIHNHPLERVHLHELSDWDSIVDVVAAAIILDHFSQAVWTLSRLPLGSGLVNTQHGLIPVPAPATSEILKGFEFIDDGVSGERITPTGAAILSYIKNETATRQVTIAELTHTGYGLGERDLKGMPNILRVLSFEQRDSQDKSTYDDTVAIIEFEIDDMTGEEIGCAVTTLRALSGVLDVLFYRANGKKGRDFTCIRVISSIEQFDDVVNACFLQTSTIGLRYSHVSRRCLNREVVAISNGDAYKVVNRPDGINSVKAEHDCIEDEIHLEARRKKKRDIESLKPC